MSNVAIVSDSNSGITQSMAKELGITVMPMPFFVGDKTLYEDIDLSQEEFYQMLSEKTDIHTSMPLVGNVTDTWDEMLKEYDETDQTNTMLVHASIHNSTYKCVRAYR